MSEHSKDQDENLDKIPTIEELQAQLTDLNSKLDAKNSSYDRVLEESKKYKEGLQGYKAKEDEITKAAAKKEEERLIKEGQFSTLLEQREARIQELEGTVESTLSEVKTRDTAIINFKKAQAFQTALGGTLKKDAYWNHVDFDKIATNPETGQIDRASLDTVVNGFSEEYGELVDFGNNPNLPNSTPRGGSNKLTHDQWKKLPLAEKKKRMKDVID